MDPKGEEGSVHCLLSWDTSPASSSDLPLGSWFSATSLDQKYDPGSPGVQLADYTSWDVSASSCNKPLYVYIFCWSLFQETPDQYNSAKGD